MKRKKIRKQKMYVSDVMIFECFKYFKDWYEKYAMNEWVGLSGECSAQDCFSTW